MDDPQSWRELLDRMTPIMWARAAALIMVVVLPILLATTACRSGGSEVPPSAPTSTPAPTYRSCAEVSASQAAPLSRGNPGYSPQLDRDGDGVACDR